MGITGRTVNYSGGVATPVLLQGPRQKEKRELRKQWGGGRLVGRPVGKRENGVICPKLTLSQLARSRRSLYSNF